MNTLKSSLVKLSFVGIMTFLSHASLASVVTIDFEDGTGHEQVMSATQYGNDVVFTNAVWVSRGSSFHNGSFGLGVDAGLSAHNNWAFPGFSSPIRIDLANTTDFVSIWSFDVGIRGAIMEAFDSFGQSVGLADAGFGIGAGTGNNVFLSINANSISYVELRQAEEGNFNIDGISFDDFSYSSQSVPEPSQIVLLLVALLTVAVRHQFRQNKYHRMVKVGCNKVSTLG